MKSVTYTCDVEGCKQVKQPSNGWWVAGILKVDFPVVKIETRCLAVVMAPWDNATFDPPPYIERFDCCGPAHALKKASELMERMREVPSGERVK